MIRAGIDLGTNTIRLLIIDDDGNDLVREMRIVRLGQGIDKSKVFADAALHRTFVAVKEYGQICQKWNVQKINFLATSAARDAKNKSDLINGINNILGIEPQIISGEHEAKLSFQGATYSLPSADKTLVIDIGGGSTEFGLGTVGQLENSISLNIGSVRIKEKFSMLVPPVKSELSAAVNFINEQLDTLGDLLTLPKSIIGVAGTVTTLAMYKLKITEYDFNTTHGYSDSVANFITAAQELLCENYSELIKYMPPKRADVIQSGVLIFLQILKRLKSEQIITVSERDILDSIARI